MYNVLHYLNEEALIMELLKNRYFKRISWSLATFLLVVFFLVISTSYLNTKEIRLLTSGCYENRGEVIIEIHNNLTSAYSFECK